MSRIRSVFESLKSEQKTALIPYVTAGYPSPDATVEVMHGFVDGGADIIELGVPFSDPVADGPVIQQANDKALSHNVTLKAVLAMVKQFRLDNQYTPVVLMGYMNPIEQMGHQTFIQQAVDADIDGVLIVDCPPEDNMTFIEMLKENNIDSIVLSSPTTDKNRLVKLMNLGSGYLYHVGLKGITGADNLNIQQLESSLSTIKSLSPLPVAIGFGIKTPEDARNLSPHVDGIIVGSKLVNEISRIEGNSKAINSSMCTLVKRFRIAIDQ